MPLPTRFPLLRRPASALLSPSHPLAPPPVLLLLRFSSLPARPPPRKGRQAIRRLLKLLPPRRHSPNHPALSAALDALEGNPHALSPSHAAALVSAVANPLLSFDFYRFLRAAQGTAFRPDSCLFSSLLGSQLGSISPHPFRIRFYLEQTKKYVGRFSYGDFRCLFGALFPGRSALARSFLDEVVEVLGPDSATFAAAISVYIDNGLVEDARKVAERAKREIEGHHAVEFYSSLMALHRLNKDAKAAMETFLGMEEEGVAADEGIYRTLLEILCGFGWAKLCWAILEEMRKRGSFSLPESLGLELMRTFFKRDMVHEAEWLFREGILKEDESFSSFAELMAEKRMPLVAFELLKTAGHLQDCSAFLIRGCGKVGLIEEAERIFREIRCCDNIEVQRSLLSSMIYVYTRAGLRRSAETLWEQLEASGGFTEEASICMMSMYGEMGLLGDVEKVFDWWKHSGLPMNEDSYFVLINALIKTGRLNKARDCLLEMRKVGIQPTSRIYSHMMEGYLKAGILNLAAALLDEYKSSGLTSDDETTASLIIQVLVQTGRKTPFDLAVDAAGDHDNSRPLLALLLLDDLLHRAAALGDAGGVRSCLARGAAVDCRDQNGWTPLHRAAFKGRAEVAEILIEHGAEVDAADGAGWTPLRCAAESGRDDVAIMLAVRGAKLAAAGLKGLAAAEALLAGSDTFPGPGKKPDPMVGRCVPSDISIPVLDSHLNPP
ncbi:hypothetical protein Taro_009277 [Colocasia esculenta]|uniref:Pentatricopeptide repeat-containing protein n=1 Tax=Colocasia esculenta TaxID=4460 RepID=A0A843TZX5_COLES|nr:hypothetical protein [Colocasia esculenta]